MSRKTRKRKGRRTIPNAPQPRDDDVARLRRELATLKAAALPFANIKLPPECLRGTDAYVYAEFCRSNAPEMGNRPDFQLRDLIRLREVLGLA